MIKIRELQTGSVQCEPFDCEAVGSDPIRWLQEQAQTEMILLAHATDGIIWGCIRADTSGQLTIVYPSNSVHQQAALRAETLCMARLFNQDQEIFLWSVHEGKWRARILHDGIGSACEYFDEPQILWGTDVEAAGEGFSRLVEGQEGMHHAPPLEIMPQAWRGKHRVRLHVRHYLEQDDVGWQRIAFSRLTSLEEWYYSDEEEAQ